MSESDLERSQKSMVEHFANIVKNFSLLTIFCKNAPL